MSEERSIDKILKLTEKKKSEKIAKFLDDKDVEVVKAAIIGLGMIQDETSVNLLSKLIDDPSPEIRIAAIKAFAKGGTSYAKTFLQHLMTKEKNAEVKEVCADELHNFKKE